jgi:phosphoribosyl 1,2-cyclic phosphodiesterase
MPSPGPQTNRHGGNTSCVEVRADDGHLVVLDAGTGIAALGRSVAWEIAADPTARVDVLLTHLHLDHIQGLGFFAPLFTEGTEVHVWGPMSATMHLRGRLTRYLSPPLFPVPLRDLPCRLHLHDVPLGAFDLPGLHVDAALVCHPGPTVGYRLTSNAGTMAYLPDHEPALGAVVFPGPAAWTSGYDLAAGVDLLIHDAQSTDEEYAERVGWGHSTFAHATAFAALAGARRLVAFHHDPAHDDDFLDTFLATPPPPGLEIVAAREGTTFEVTRAAVDAGA